MEYDDYMEGDLFEDNFAENDQSEQFESVPTEETDENDALKSVWKKTEGSKSKQAKTSTLRAPRPKLSEKELISSKGLPALKQLFENYKCPENVDPYKSLKQILTKMEYWAHGLYPKFNFEDFLDRVEVIGHKRLVRTSLYRLRVGLSLDEIRVGGKNDEKKEDNDDDDEKFYGEKATAEEMFDEQFKKDKTTKETADIDAVNDESMLDDEAHFDELMGVVDEYKDEEDYFAAFDEMDIEAAPVMKSSVKHEEKERSPKKKPTSDREEESDDEIISAANREEKKSEPKSQEELNENKTRIGNFAGDFNQDYWSDDSN